MNISKKMTIQDTTKQYSDVFMFERECKRQLNANSLNEK